MPGMTIKEAADALGVTKNAIRYQLGKMPASFTSKDAAGVVRLQAGAFDALQEIFLGNKQENTREKAGNFPSSFPSENALYSALEETIRTLSKQLEEKDRQLEAANNEKQQLLRLLDQQQQLNAGQIMATAEKRLEEPKGEPEAVQASQEQTQEQEQPKRGIFARIFGGM